MPTVTKCILVQLFIDMDYETVKLFTNSHQSNSDFNKKSARHKLLQKKHKQNNFKNSVQTATQM